MPPSKYRTCWTRIFIIRTPIRSTHAFFRAAWSSPASHFAFKNLQIRSSLFAWNHTRSSIKIMYNSPPVLEEIANMKTRTGCAKVSLSHRKTTAGLIAGLLATFAIACTPQENRPFPTAGGAAGGAGAGPTSTPAFPTQIQLEIGGVRHIYNLADGPVYNPANRRPTINGGVGGPPITTAMMPCCFRFNGWTCGSPPCPS